MVVPDVHGSVVDALLRNDLGLDVLVVAFSDRVEGNQ